MEISSQYAFGSRAIGEGENVVPPNSDVTFVVKLVAINELLAPEVEEEVPTRTRTRTAQAQATCYRVTAFGHKSCARKTVISHGSFLTVTHCVPLLRRTGGSV